MTALDKMAIRQIAEEARGAQSVMVSNTEHFQTIGKTDTPGQSVFSKLMTIARWADALLEDKSA